MAGRRAASLTFGWAVGYGGFGVACALTGTPVFAGGGHRAPASVDWAVVAFALLTAGAALAARQGPRPVVRGLLWALCGLSVVSAFGLLMSLITLVFGEGVDSRAATANQALAAVGTVLLARAARTLRSPVARDVAVRREPVPASRPIRLTAWAGTLAFAPYAAMKTVWALDGTFAGTNGAEMRAIAERNGASGLWLTLESWGLDGTALLAALGVFLLFGLVRPWGQVFPRWIPFLGGRRVPPALPLVPAVIGAATLAPYGTAGICYAVLGTAGVVTVPRGDFHSSSDALLVAWVGLAAFAVYGAALIVAARSYWQRTR
ncbi:hypothetical protein GCM10023195_26390 [Actinoallomurus liliacearum]|uniref:Integral membrane protein n=2 Tax=Actinoallomurus liliacearum TaxID=1080073 RepID=A0ABP8TFM0_9ACTN